MGISKDFKGGMWLGLIIYFPVILWLWFKAWIHKILHIPFNDDTIW